LESREERARQQEIVLSELAQPGESRSLGDILVNAGILTREQLAEALDEQQKDPTQLLGTILIERDFTTDDAIAQAVACQLEKPVVNPMEVHIQQNALDALHRDLCTWHVCIPLRITPDRLVVAMANPLDESAIMKLRDVSQREITPVVGTPSHIMGAIDNYYGTF
jgi:type IV pilus assembly protein PilB